MLGVIELCRFEKLENSNKETKNGGESLWKKVRFINS